MAKKKDTDETLFERLHDAENIKKLHQQSKREQRLKRRLEWWNEHKPK